MNTKNWIVMGLICVMVLPVAAAEKESVALTVYNGGYGVVREIRNLDIGADGNVKFKDVARLIDATTVHFKSLTDAKAKLLEQNYQYDLVSANKLLHKYIDKPIEVICEKQTYSGTLLSFDAGQLVLRSRKGGIIMVQRADNVRDIRFGALPGGLLTRPTLLWLVATRKPGKHTCEVTYQTTGLGWHAEYVLVLGGDDATADLSGWVSVNNASGKTYKDAKLKFIAGDVRRVRPPARDYSGRVAKGRSRGGAEPMREKAFFEYHMYTLPRPSTVADNETKQLEMFTPARGLKIEKKYLYDPMGQRRWHWGGRYTNQSYGLTSYKKVNVFIEFQNAKKNKLGMPLPAGKIRVYKQDPEDKALEFIGEERIDHTPKDEKLSLKIGNAFDVVGERKQKEYQTRPHWSKEVIEIKIRNHKKTDIIVRVKEPLYRCKNWTITAESHPKQRAGENGRLDSRTVAWDVPVKAEGETVVTYTVEYTW